MRETMAQGRRKNGEVGIHVAFVRVRYKTSPTVEKEETKDL